MKRVAVVVLLASTMFLASAPGAPAMLAPHEWSYGPAVGRCGTVAEPYVRMAQAILWATGDLRTLADVDGIWGRETFLAVKSYQWLHGLSMTGCVTAATWDDMQYAEDPFGVRSHLRRVDGCKTPGVSACEAWVFKEINLGYFDLVDRIRYDRRVRFEWVDPGCWVLVKLENLRNGRRVVLNEHVTGSGNVCVVAT